MSDALGMVKFKDGTILYCYYAGASDIMSPSLHEEINDIWEKSNWEVCECYGEDVLIYNEYGGGETYTGRACKEHKCITFDFNNYMEDYNYWSYDKINDNESKLSHDKILIKNWKRDGMLL